MRKKRFYGNLLAAALITVCLIGCGKAEEAEFVELPENTITQTEKIPENIDISSKEDATVLGKGVSSELTIPFSFVNFEELTFTFSSGAGAWSTELAINEDGSFQGEYHDTDLGSIGDEHPNGTRYYSSFTGQLAEPVQVNDYTYSVEITELNYANKPGTEEILDGVLYCYSEAYGLQNTDSLLIYLPEAPVLELPEGYRSWVGYSSQINYAEDTTLNFYGLYNKADECGFSSYYIVEQIKKNMTYTEETSNQLKDSLKNDP